jgi:hypothetical protein
VIPRTEAGLESGPAASTGARRGLGPEVRRRRAARARRHWCFLVVFFAGVALRVVTQIAYRPALLYIDSYRYLENVRALNPTLTEPIGYNAIVLRPLLWAGNLATVAVAQHVLGLAMGVAIYTLLLRYRVRPWLAALAIAPLMLDAYQLQIEHNLLSETLFEALIVAAVVVLLWRRRSTWSALAVGGLLLGVSVSVRTVGLPLVAPAALFAALASPGGWRRLGQAAVLTAAFALPVVGYGAYFSAVAGRIGLSTADASVIYGRAATIVDCRHLELPSYERVLCPPQPLGHRLGVDNYAHINVLDKEVHPPPGETTNQVLRNFAVRVFRHQPLDLMHAVLADFIKGFALSPTTSHNDVPVSRWQFQVTYPTFPPHDPQPVTQTYGGGKPTTVTALTEFLRDYQLSIGFAPGPLLGAAFLAGLLGAVGVGRARRSGLQAACLLATLVGLILLLGADIYEFSWRYQLPALVFAPLGGALGVTALLRRPPRASETTRLRAHPALLRLWHVLSTTSPGTPTPRPDARPGVRELTTEDSHRGQ